MPKLRRGRPIVLCAAATLLLSGAVGAMEPAVPPTWLPLLKLQLEEANGCVLSEVLTWRDMRVGNDIGTEGRVRCIDSREYDFTRQREHQKFTLRLCQPAVC